MNKVSLCLLALLLSAPLFAAGQLSGSLNINTADHHQLVQLPGIGSSKASAIIAQRKQGKFGTTQELLKIRGIGPKLLAKFERYVSVSGGNTLRSTPSSSPASR